MNMQSESGARSQFLTPETAAVAQLAERVLGKDEVMGSNPISSLPCCRYNRVCNILNRIFAGKK